MSVSTSAHASASAHATHGESRSESSSDVHDRVAIAAAIADWGICRDGGRWDQLGELYAPGGTMVTTWCRASGEEFVRRSREASGRGANVQHLMGSPSIRLNGARALVDTRVTILVRTKIDSVAIDVSCVGRFHDRFVRNDGRWRILLRTPIYDKDWIVPVHPGERIALDQAALARFPEGCRYLAYTQSLVGQTFTPDLPTPNSDEEKALYKESDAWLNGK